MDSFMTKQGLLLKEFKPFVSAQSERLKQHARAVAEKSGRPYIHLNGEIGKEQKARAIADCDGITEGLICILAAVEACQSFHLVPAPKRPRLIPARRKCLCLYFYFIDPQLGFMHVRIPTWFPFSIQIYLNGHEWLARKLNQHAIPYSKLENAFVRIDNPQRAQRFSDQLASYPQCLCPTL